MGSVLPSDRYERIRSLGAGGFASVWLARDHALDDLVALKVLRPDLAQEPDMRARFVREARLLRRVRSERVIAVHDIGELADGTPFFVMAYADGGTLADRLGDGPLAAATAVNLAVETARAVAVLHDQGVVHRDIKPSNILFRGAGAAPERLVIGDLGLAVDADASEPSLVGGTPVYMAPEQAAGPRSDVYSLGVLTHRLLTGALPTAAAPGVPGRIGREIGRALSADPLRRHRDAAAFAESLATAAGPRAEHDSIRTTVHRPRGRRRAALALALLAVTPMLAGDVSATPGPSTALAPTPPAQLRAARTISRSTAVAVDGRYDADGSPSASIRVPARTLVVVTTAVQGGKPHALNCGVTNSGVRRSWVELAYQFGRQTNVWVHYWFNNSDSETAMIVKSACDAKGYNPFVVQEVELMSGAADPVDAPPRLAADFRDIDAPAMTVRTAAAGSLLMLHFGANLAHSAATSLVSGSAVSATPASLYYSSHIGFAAGVIYRESTADAGADVQIGVTGSMSKHTTGVVIEYPPALV